MIRVVVFLVVTGLIALGIGWLADRPGEVVIEWLGLHIETSIMVAIGAFTALLAAILILWSLIGFILRSPALVARTRLGRRRARSFHAISRGLIAIGAGDVRGAAKLAEEARQLVPNEPLALLLSAQAAQLAGDHVAAETTFRVMSRRADTKLLGLRGLYVEAQRHDDLAMAQRYAEEAAHASPGLPWAGTAVLEARCLAADWEGALAVLDRNLRGGLLDKPAYRRLRAVLLTARALALADERRETAKTLSTEAVKLAPDLVPAAVLAGRLLAEAGEIRKATKMLEAAWAAHPHPDLADLYAHLKSGASARDRLARVENLVKQPAHHVEGALALARAALDANDHAKARAALAPLLAAPTQRVATLMAELEEAEHGDDGRSRAWMNRALRAARDPAWTADGYVAQSWMPVSPVSGHLDAFRWKVPVGELGVRAPFPEIIHEAPRTIDAASVKPPEAEPAPAPPAIAGTPARPATGTGAMSPPRRTAAVIPLLRVPDDPGPEADLPAEPMVEKVRGSRLFFW